MQKSQEQMRMERPNESSTRENLRDSQRETQSFEVPEAQATDFSNEPPNSSENTWNDDLSSRESREREFSLEQRERKKEEGRPQEERVFPPSDGGDGLFSEKNSGGERTPEEAHVFEREREPMENRRESEFFTDRVPEATLEGKVEQPPAFQIPQVRSDLVTWVLGRNYGKSRGNKYQPTKAKEWASFSKILMALLQGRATQAARSAPSIGMQVLELLEPSGKRYWVLMESGSSRGWGIYVVPLRSVRDFVVQVPHPIADLHTHAQGAYLMQELQPRLLMIASLQRCESPTKTRCSGSTSLCQGAYRISDVAHHTENFFQEAHRLLVRIWPKWLVIQLHGFARRSGEPSAYLSDGTKSKTGSTSPSSRLRDAMNIYLKPLGLFSARSCNDPKGKSVRLCGTTNVQGRVSNGSTNACLQAAKQGSGTFLHLEQRLRLRRGTSPGPALLKNALLQLFPVPP